jgi:hypothetical protein
LYGCETWSVTLREEHRLRVFENRVLRRIFGPTRDEVTWFWWESLKERDKLKDQGVDGRMGSKWILGRLVGGVEWIHLAQDRDRWRAVVNAVMNLRVLSPRSYLVDNSSYKESLEQGMSNFHIYNS